MGVHLGYARAEVYGHNGKMKDVSGRNAEALSEYADSDGVFTML